MSPVRNSLKSVLGTVGAAALLGCASTNAMACGDNAYLGEVCTFAFDYCPQNFAPANGQILQIAQNSALFALLGNRYGGDGRTTFGLPDLRGRSPIHYGQGPGLSPVSIAQSNGVENATLTNAQLPVHSHAITGQASGAVTTTVTVNALTTETAGAVTAPASGANTIGKIAAGSPAYYPYSAAKAVPVPVTASVNTAGVSPGTVTLPVTASAANAGASQPFSVLNPRLALNYCIATSGIFPPRP